MYDWYPVEKIMKQEGYDDSHLGVSNKYGIYIRPEKEGEEK